MAALARPLPIEAATSATVAPAGISRFDPSGNSTCIVVSKIKQGRLLGPVACSLRSNHRQGGGGVSVVRVVAVVDDVRMEQRIVALRGRKQTVSGLSF